MIVDTSVLVSLLREEAVSARFVPVLLANYGDLRMSAANYLEAGIVIDSIGDDVLTERLDRVIQHFGIVVESVTVDHARIARSAYRSYGKGRHPARLNFGDCFAYALARWTDEALLFKGDDFTLTDVKIASSPDD